MYQNVSGSYKSDIINIEPIWLTRLCPSHVAKTMVSQVMKFIFLICINFINHKNFGLLQQDIERLGLNSLQKILKSFFFNLKDKKGINTTIFI